MQSKKCGYVALLVSYTKKCWVFLQIHTQDVTSRYHPLRWPKAKQVSIRSGEWVLSASQLAVWYQMPWVWPRGELNLSRAPRRVASSERKRQPIQHESEWERQGCRQGTLGQGLQVYGYLWRRSFGQVRLYRHFFIEFSLIEFYSYSAKLQQQSPQIFKYASNEHDFDYLK